MRPVALGSVVVVLAALALSGGFALGWTLRPTPSSPPAVLSIVAAGSLAPVLPPIASEFAAATPGVSAPSAAQVYEGSVAAANLIGQQHQRFDLLATADFRVIPQHLEPTGATWEIVFASDPLVLAYDPSAAGMSGINTSNWPAKLAGPGVLLGVANASTDPLGYNVIFALELEDSTARSQLYPHFYVGALGAFAAPNSATTRVLPETNAAAVLAAHEVQAYMVYRSYASVSRLSYVELGPSANLGSTDPSAVQAYASAKTTIQGASGPSHLSGAPILFALTVPSTAPDPALGELFVAFLLSPHTASTLSLDGFDVLPSYWADQPAHVPAALSGSISPLPWDLASEV